MIHFFHVPKTAGRTIHRVFYSLVSDDPQAAYYNACGQRDVTLQGKRFLAWAPNTAMQKPFFYSHSHRPVAKTWLPKGTKTFTCLRDPLERFQSYYRMLREIAENPEHIHHGTEHLKQYHANPVAYVMSAPQKHVCAYTEMFGKQFPKLDAVLLQSDLAAGIKRLGEVLGLPLELKSNHPETRPDVEFSAEFNKIARERLKPDYELLKEVLR